jgi:hypothetical protein
MFNHDWFHRGGLSKLVEASKRRCTEKHFESEEADESDREAYCAVLETRTILYMKDGLTYEMNKLVDIGQTGCLGFECIPVDESYRVGAIVIVCPFEDIARVEVFAVHPDEKPQEQFRITGFRATSPEPREM